MAKKTTLEKASFCVPDGSFSLAFVERVDHRKRKVYEKAGPYSLKTEVKNGTLQLKAIKEEVAVNRRYYLEARTSAFGSGVTFRFPLIPVMVEWLMDILPQVHEHMTLKRDEPTDGLEFAFREGFCHGKAAHIKVRDSRECEYDWPITGQTVSVSDGAAQVQESALPLDQATANKIEALIRWRNMATDRYGDDFIGLVLSELAPEDGRAAIEVPDQFRDALRVFQALPHKKQLELIKLVDDPPAYPGVTTYDQARKEWLRLRDADDLGGETEKRLLRRFPGADRKPLPRR